MTHVVQNACRPGSDSCHIAEYTTRRSRALGNVSYHGDVLVNDNDNEILRYRKLSRKR